MKRVIVAMTLLVGCGGDEREMGQVRKPIPLKEVPENIIKIAEGELKEAKIFEPAFTKTKKDGTFISYEVRGKNPKTGKVNEVGIAKDGTIVDRENLD